MAITVPALPASLADPGELGTGQPILGGSGSALGLLVASSNLAHATLGAGTAWQQVWADGQFAVTGADDTDQVLRLRIPYVSGAHLSVRCSVRASGGGTSADFVRVTCPANAETERTADIGADATYSVDLDLTGGLTTTAIDGGRDYYDLQVFVGGTVDVRSLHLAVLPTLPVTGSWPGSAGTLSGATVDGFVPLDVFEVEEEEPLAADLGNDLRGNLDALRDRVRVRHAWAGVTVPTPTDSLYPEMPPIWQRIEGHCLSPREPLRAAGYQTSDRWEVWFYAVSDTEPNVLIVEAIADGFNRVELARLEVAAGTTGWQHLWVDPQVSPAGELGPLWTTIRIRAAGARPRLGETAPKVDDAQDADNHINAIVVWGP